MARLTDLQKKKIVADYINNQNYCETARMNNVNESSVRRIVKEGNYEEIARKSEQKKLENTQSTLEYMQTQHETKKRILDKLLRGIELKADDVNELTSIKDLATAYGIILDKELKVLEIQKQQKETKSNGVLDDLMEALKNVKDTKQ